jgi:DNA-binding NarL/FixJ family response regulator
VRRELRAEGWRLRDGWDLPAEPFDLSLERVACIGAVTDERDAASALMAATRGSRVVVTAVSDRGLLAALLEDLRRVGPVEYREPPGERPGELDPELVTLLGLLADGAALEEAAEQLNYSRRTVARRLVKARSVLKVRTTAEALVEFRRRREQRDVGPASRANIR